MKYFLDTLIQKIFFCIIRINIFWGELADNSAKKEALALIQLAILGLACSELGTSKTAHTTKQAEHVDTCMCLDR